MLSFDFMLYVSNFKLARLLRFGCCFSLSWNGTSPLGSVKSFFIISDQACYCFHSLLIPIYWSIFRPLIIFSLIYIFHTVFYEHRQSSSSNPVSSVPHLLKFFVNNTFTFRLERGYSGLFVLFFSMDIPSTLRISAPFSSETKTCPYLCPRPEM